MQANTRPSIIGLLSESSTRGNIGGALIEDCGRKQPRGEVDQYYIA